MILWCRFPKYLEILAPESYKSVGKYNVFTGKKVACGSSGHESRQRATSKKSKALKKQAGGSVAQVGDAQAADVGSGAEIFVLSELEEFLEKSVFKPFTYHVSCILGVGIEPLVYTPDSLPSGLTQTQATQTQSNALSGNISGRQALDGRESQVTQLSDGAILQLLKSSVQWCKESPGSGGNLGGLAGDQEVNNPMLMKVHTLRQTKVFCSLSKLLDRIQLTISSGRGRGDESNVLESSEVPVERDIHLQASKEGKSGVSQFDLLEQILCLYGVLLDNKDLQEEFLSTAGGYVKQTRQDKSSSERAFRVPLLIQISDDLGNANEEVDRSLPRSDTVETLQDLAASIERALQGLFETFRSIVLGILKHRTIASAGFVRNRDGDDDPYIEFEDADVEEGTNVSHMKRHEGESGSSKPLTSRNDVHMTYAVAIVQILDNLLHLSSKLLESQQNKKNLSDENNVCSVLSALLAPTALPLQLSDVCKSLLQYDWANSRLKDGRAQAGYTYSTKDLPIFVQVLLKYSPDPLEKVKFMVNELFLDELKVRHAMLCFQ